MGRSGAIGAKDLTNAAVGARGTPVWSRLKRFQNMMVEQIAGHLLRRTM